MIIHSSASDPGDQTSMDQTSMIYHNFPRLRIELARDSLKSFYFNCINYCIYIYIYSIWSIALFANDLLWLWWDFELGLSGSNQNRWSLQKQFNQGRRQSEQHFETPEARSRSGNHTYYIRLVPFSTQLIPRNEPSHLEADRLSR